MLTDKWHSCELQPGVEDHINGAGAKGTREGGKLVIPEIECTRLQEPEEGWCRKGGNPKRFERDK